MGDQNDCDLSKWEYRKWGYCHWCEDGEASIWKLKSSGPLGDEMCRSCWKRHGLRAPKRLVPSR